MNSSELTIRDVMQTNFTALEPDTDIYTAIKIIISKDLMGVPVVSGSHLVGVFSEKDCFRVLSNWVFQMSNETGGTIDKFMTKDVITIQADMNISILISKFLTHYYRGLPVVDGDKLVGLVSRRDILKALMQIEEEQRTSGYPDSKYGNNIPGIT